LIITFINYIENKTGEKKIEKTQNDDVFISPKQKIATFFIA
jgi:hypothetical protein